MHLLSTPSDIRAAGTIVSLDVFGLIQATGSVAFDRTLVGLDLKNPVGMAAGSKAELDLGLLLRKRLHLVGTVLRSRPLEEKIALAREFADALAQIDGEISVPELDSTVEVRRDRWTPSDGSGQAVAIEVYYHPGHEENVDRMLQSMQASLTYFVLRYLGYDVTLYDGSFVEWSNAGETIWS